MDLNPFKLIAAGSMLITATDGDKIVNALNSEGIEASIIGKITDEGSILSIKMVDLLYSEPPKEMNCGNFYKNPQ